MTDAIALIFFAVVIILGPIAAYRTLKNIRGGNNRPFVPGRDCRNCGGWGTVNGEVNGMRMSVPCQFCGGRRTR
jgi:hypothetical protein